MARRGSMPRLTSLVVGATIGLLAWSAGPASAKYKCTESKCTNPSIVAEVRAAVDAGCDCASFAKKRDWSKCWKPIVNGFKKELGKTGFPKACQKDVKRALSNSTCGRPGTVLCRKLNVKKGKESCKVAKESRCKDIYPPDSVCGAFVSCAEACNPDACTTTTLVTTTTTTTLPGGALLKFTTGPAGGVCGEIRSGGASGTILRSLTCGGLNVGGGCYQEGGACGVSEGPTPANAVTTFNAVCTASSCDVSARTAAETGSNDDCSDVGCQFGTWLSIANGGTSTCVLNTFSSPGSGTLDLTTGAFDGSVPLTSAVTVTGNGVAPCPQCLDMPGGSPVQGSGVCSAAAANAGAACEGVNSNGDSYECIPSGVPLTPFPVDLTPISTGTTFMDTTTDMDQVPGGVAGEFCPGQDMIEPGSLGCFGSSKAAPVGPDPLCDYIEERGSDAAGIAMDGGPVAGTLASVFCIPAAGNGLIDGAADLPGPGATSLPGTLELISGS